MADGPTINYAALQTPPEDGTVLVQPAAALLPSLVQKNRAYFDTLQGGISGQDWGVVRCQARMAMGVDPDLPIVMTGHQPEFLHAGVWAKNVVTHRLAMAVDGTAVNLVVDNDVPKSLAIQVPVVHEGKIAVHSVPVAETLAGRSYECLPAIKRESVQWLRERLQLVMGSAFEQSLLSDYLVGMTDPAGDDFAAQNINGRRSIEIGFDIDLRESRVSSAWGGAMLTDWLCRSREFAEAYNLALAEYRREQRVRQNDRPIPDLVVELDRVESPLWIYQRGGPRRRLFVQHVVDRIGLFAEDELIVEISVDELKQDEKLRPLLAQCGSWVIRPRALTLTLWARLAASDFFIHGIGGAKYDRITDTIIRRYYGLEPPAMACVSATMHLPLPRSPVSEAELYAARRDLRDLQHQPDRWAGGDEAESLRVARLGAIEESVQLRQNRPRDHAARHAAYHRIRELNASLHSLCRHHVPLAQARLDKLLGMEQQDRLATGREYFFALFSRDRLKQLLAALPTF